MLLNLVQYLAHQVLLGEILKRVQDDTSWKFQISYFFPEISINLIFPVSPFST